MFYNNNNYTHITLPYNIKMHKLLLFFVLSLTHSRTHTDNNNRSALSGSYLGLYFDMYTRHFEILRHMVLYVERIFSLMSCLRRRRRSREEKEKRFRLLFLLLLLSPLFFTCTRSSLLMCISSNLLFVLFFSSFSFRSRSCLAFYFHAHCNLRRTIDCKRQKKFFPFFYSIAESYVDDFAYRYDCTARNFLFWRLFTC